MARAAPEVSFLGAPVLSVAWAVLVSVLVVHDVVDDPVEQDVVVVVTVASLVVVVEAVVVALEGTSVVSSLVDPLEIVVVVEVGVPTAADVDVVTGTMPKAGVEVEVVGEEEGREED